MRVQNISSLRPAVYKTKANKLNNQNNINQNKPYANVVSFGLVPPVPPVPVDPLTALASLALTFLLMLGIGGTKDSFENHQIKKEEFNKYKEEFKDIIANDLEKFAKANNLNLKQAQAVYTNRFKKALILNTDLAGQKLGINSVNGHPKEKLQMLLNVIIPITEAAKSPSDKTKNALPNGVLFTGANSETNENLIKALKSHLSYLNTYSFEVDLNSENSDDLLKAVNSVKDNFQETGHYSLLHLKNADKLQQTEKLDLLKNIMENSAQNGAIVLYDTTDINNNIPPELLRPGRTGVIINVE